MFNALALFWESGLQISGDDLLLIPFALLGIFIMYKWLSKKKIPILEQKKWLKILISVVVGTVLSLFIVTFAIIIFAIHLFSKQKV